MKKSVSNIQYKHNSSIIQAGRDKLILSNPSPIQERDSRGKMNYLSQGEYYG
jgi:hypothetical protein